jgi:hypothetical protein
MVMYLAPLPGKQKAKQQTEKSKTDSTYEENADAKTQDQQSGPQTIPEDRDRQDPS